MPITYLGTYVDLGSRGKIAAAQIPSMSSHYTDRFILPHGAVGVDGRTTRAITRANA